MKYPDSGSTSLLDIYKPETKKRPENNIIIDVEVEEKTEKNEDDFSGPEPEKESPFPEIQEKEEIVQDPPEPQKPVMPYEEQAELLIDFVDGAGQLLLPLAYQASMFTRSEYKRLKEIERQSRRKEESTLTPEDQELMSKYDDYKLLLDAIPYGEKEIQFQTGPLAAVMKKRNWNVSAELLLVMSMVVVNGKRFMPLLSKFRI